MYASPQYINIISVDQKLKGYPIASRKFKLAPLLNYRENPHRYVTSSTGERKKTPPERLNVALLLGHGENIPVRYSGRRFCKGTLAKAVPSVFAEPDE